MRDAAPVALVTGAARRIGASIARELHAAGCRVVLHYRGSREEALALAVELETHRHDSAIALAADLANPAAIDALAKGAVARWGRLDVLVNNASGFFPTPLGEVSRADWDSLFDSNLKGPFFLTQALLPALRASRGAVVNIVDVYATLPLPRHAPYTMAKAGVAMMTRALALELGPDIRVNGVSPGAILWPSEQNPELGETQAAGLLAQTALKRIGEPGDIARAVRYLALDAPYVTGQILAVDGGRTLF
ncbi:MAG: pteridine reductase [Gammaproteobacteria bacterium]